MNASISQFTSSSNLEIVSTAEMQLTKAAIQTQDAKPTKQDLKLQRWESYRAEIHQTYIEQNHTAQETIRMLKVKYQFTPSVRKFKEKLKEWRLEKYLSAEETKFIATKARVREEEGKSTAFFKNGVAIDQRRIEKSAKRKREDLEEVEASAVATPQQITYQTPHPDQSDGSHSPYFERYNSRARSHELHVSEPLDPHALAMQGDGKEVEDLSKTPTSNLNLPDAPPQSPKNIQNNGQRFSDSFDMSNPSPGESIQALTMGQGLPMSQPETTIAPEESSFPELEAGVLCHPAEARKPGTRFFVDFEPESQTLHQTAINKLRDELFKVEASDVTSLETLEVMCNLAKKLGESNKATEVDEAVLLYRRTILGSETLGTDGFRLGLDAKFYLGKLLYNGERYGEAETLLAAAIAGYKSLQLDHLEIAALGSLLDLAIKVNDTEKITAVKFRMQHLFDRWRWNDPACAKKSEMPYFLLEVIHWSRVCFLTSTSEAKTAVLLLQVALVFLEHLDESKHGTDILEAYLEFGCWCQISRLYGRASKYLHLARDLLRRAIRHDADGLLFVEDRLKEVALREQGSYETPWDEARRESLEILGAAATAEEVQGQARKPDRHKPHNDSSTMETESSAYGSSRYGMTYPGSESTGGGISEFLYP